MRATRDIRRVLADEHGVSIVFAMLLLVVLLILGGIILSYGYSGYRRATQDVSDQQAGYNVRSATDLVYAQFGVGQTAQWAQDALAAASASPDGTAERTLSVTGAANFDDVTIRVKKTADVTYDVAVYEKNTVDAAGRVDGAAYHFTVTYANGDVTNKGNVEKVGQ